LLISVRCWKVPVGPVKVRGLRRRYGDLDAVDGVDLDITRGLVFALRGPNGAGKSTTVEILEGYRHRPNGAASVLGVGSPGLQS
jgi:ABC-2 type transport system ATP-binding protein